MLPRFRPNLSLSVFLNKSDKTIEDLESFVSQITGYPEVVWFPYARTAIFTYFKCLKVKNSEVALSPFNCQALGNAIKKAEFHPYYVDTKLFNIDLELLKEALKKDSVGAGIYVPLWGIRDDVSSLVREEKPILYDAALESFEAPRYSLKEEDAVVLSQGWGKTFGSYQGGFLCGVSKNQALSWKEFRKSFLTDSSFIKEWMTTLKVSIGFHPLVFPLSYWLVEKRKVDSKVLGHYSEENLFPKDWNTAYKSSILEYSFQVLEKRSQIIQKRKKLQSFYWKSLNNVPQIQIPEPNQVQSHFPILSDQRDSLYEALLKNKIFSSRNLFSKLLSDYPYLKPRNHSATPRAEKLTHTTLHLPFFDSLQEKQQALVCDTIKNYFATENAYEHPSKKVFS